MIDPLLYKVEITTSLIISKVSLVSDIPVDVMLAPEGTLLIRKREFVQARQISMTLAKEYTKLSLSSIGKDHGGRDHATVLHAKKTISGLLDVNDPSVTMMYMRTKKILDNYILAEKAFREKNQEDTIFNTEK